MIDPIALSQELIRCPSVTPRNEGALEVIERHLVNLGFTCERLDFEGICNLYASKGEGFPHFCFAGHTDVVPIGEKTLWTNDPFEGVIKDGKLWGRGASDMKCAIAAFISALSEFKNWPGRVSLLITGDEEGDALHGTQRLLPILERRGEIPDICLIGEPTSCHHVGDSIKIGRRGSITGQLTCYGKQGHIAYPQHTDNPIPRMLDCLNALYQFEFDKGSDAFEPTRFEVTSLDVGNVATNVIPYKIAARFGIRLNTLQNAHHICETIKSICDEKGGQHDLVFQVHGEAFLTKDQTIISLVQRAVGEVTDALPSLTTTGGTSDGRFISAYCPVIECGMLEATMHQVNEHVTLDDIISLRKIYQSILNIFWSEMRTQEASLTKSSSL